MCVHRDGSWVSWDTTFLGSVVEALGSAAERDAVLAVRSDADGDSDA